MAKRTRAHALLGAFAMGLLGSACQAPAPESLGQLMVALGTDMTPGRDFDRVFVFVKRGDEKQTRPFVWTYDAERAQVVSDSEDFTPLPATIAVVAEAPSDEVTLVKVVAYQGDSLRVVREARVHLPESGAQLLRMPIEWLCYNQVSTEGDTSDVETVSSSCPDGQTCIAGGCATVDVKREDLSPYEKELVFGGTVRAGDLASCFDVLACFEEATQRVPKLSSRGCGFDYTGDLDRLNVAVVLPPDSPGFCAQGACLVPLDRSKVTGWKVGGTAASPRVVLPEVLCLLHSTVLTAETTTDGGVCERQKIPDVPVCGEWGSVPAAKGRKVKGNDSTAALSVEPDADSGLPACDADAANQVQAVFDPETGTYGLYVCREGLWLPIDGGALGASLAQGALGPEGPAGALGQDGASGEVGATGPEGEAGAVGEAGATGPAGSAGKPGLDGPTGATGPAAEEPVYLVQSTAIPPSQACPGGGVLIQGGWDLSDGGRGRDGILADGEILSEVAACADGSVLAASGATGSAGSSDTVPLRVQSTPLSAGGLCANGGTSYQPYLDTSANHALDLGEEVGRAIVVCAGQRPPVGQVLDGSYSIQNPADVALLEGVGTITGTLVVQNAALSSLALPDLSSVGSLLILGNTQLTQLSLPQLQTVGGNLVFHNNPVLSSVSGLESLQAVSGTLRVSNNGSFSTFPTFGALTSVGQLDLTGTFGSLPAFAALSDAKAISIHECDVSSLSGFGALAGTALTQILVQANANLTQVSAFSALLQAQSVEIKDNPQLASISGLDQLSSVGTLSLSSNENLSSLPAFTALTSAGSILLEYDHALLDLPSDLAASPGGMFSALTTVNDVLSVSSNAGLHSLAGFAALSSVGSLRIQDNSVLATCPPFPMLTQAGTEVRIENNELLPPAAIPPFSAIVSAGIATVSIVGNGTGLGGGGGGTP